MGWRRTEVNTGFSMVLLFNTLAKVPPYAVPLIKSPLHPGQICHNLPPDHCSGFFFHFNFFV